MIESLDIPFFRGSSQTRDWTWVSCICKWIVYHLRYQGNVHTNCCSVTKPCLTLWLHLLQHARLPCLSLSPGLCANWCPLSQWCYLTLILSHPLLLLSSIFPGFRDFSYELALHIRWPKYWSVRFRICPSNEYSGYIPLWLTGFISLQTNRLSIVFSSITIQKHQFFGAQSSLWYKSHICTWLPVKS